MTVPVALVLLVPLLLLLLLLLLLQVLAVWHSGIGLLSIPAKYI